MNNFSGICAPIVETIGKNRQPFCWTLPVQKIFQLLKKKITAKLVLNLPNFNHLLQVICDASDTTIGAVLSQEGRHIAYFSENLNDSKHKYSSYDKEYYVVVQALKQ